MEDPDTTAPPQDTRPILVLTGPTASGKSAVAMAMARALAPALARGTDPRPPLEIVSVDSALVYRGMDLGTAKPDAADRAEVPHHLIDCIDAAQAYSAARFASEARQAIASIRARGALPLLVGGTMMYLKALRDGLARLPAADTAVRAEIDALAAVQGWPALHAQLQRVDPATAARLAPGDAQRIQRALEVWRLSGRPLSQWLADSAAQEGHAAPLPLRIVSLEPASRAWLHARIEQRWDAMLDAGFLEEVRALRARADLHERLPSMRCVGYRQAWAALQQDPALAPGSAGWAAFREAGIAATRQLAKRQLTWLRSMPERQVIECDAEDAPQRAVDALLAAMEQIERE